MEIINRINKIKRIVDIGRVFMHSQFFRFFTPKYNETKPSKDILVFVGMGIGDAILMLDPLFELRRMFPPEKNYRILLLCGVAVKSFLTEIGLPNTFLLLKVIFPDRLQSKFLYKDYHFFYRYCKGKQFYIVWDSYTPSLLRACLLSIITSKIRVGVKYGYKSRNIIEEKLIRREYSHAQVVPYNESRMDELKSAIYCLGNKEYKTRIPY
ncbi:MAG: hypothetical protein LBQ43_04645, partial [Holosporales bacterium]|nr:hypothetical protein [Holosporales bacterium]